MQKKNIPQAESQSADLIQENIEQLKQIFPEVIKEGRVDFDALNDLLGNYADIPEERFYLNWAGKVNARREAQKRSTGTLRPYPEESLDWGTTENLYIEGDNLEVLKLLQKSYHSRVKMIYIDPPYNTGKDFVYKDNYSDNMKNYLEQTGQDKKLSTNTESDGRYHSNWLNMMYPRLKLSRNLLAEDGVIFISIDDNEVANLRKICDEIYGEENFVAQISVQSNPRGRQSDTFMASVHDYLLMYAKNLRKCSINGAPLSDEQKSEFSFVDENGNYRLLGLRQRGSASRREDRPDMYFPIYVNPNDGKVYLEKKIGYMEVFPRKSDGTDGRWMWGKAKCETDISLLVSKMIEHRGEYDIFIKDYLNRGESERTRKYKTIWDDKKYNNQFGTQEVKALIGDVFTFPKSSKLLSDIIRMGSIFDDKSIILDFFSGSAVIAHAVMQLNAEDGGNRKYICVQLPEPTPEDSEARKAGYNTIPEIAKERIRRAGKKILEEQKVKAEKEGGLFAEGEKKLDIGFKVFKLDSSNINAWDNNPDNLETALHNSLFNIKTDRSEEDLLYEILIKYGIELPRKINRHTIAGKTVYEMGTGSLIVCLADNLTTEVAEGIGKLYEEVSPDGIDGNCRVVFKDSGFNGSDEIKTNTLLILKQHGITNVASV